jgi:altronate hydrolase
MNHSVVKIHPKDNVWVALRDLKAGQSVELEGQTISVFQDVPAKHKITTAAMNVGDKIYMYGVLVGEIKIATQKGEWLTTFNLKHAASDFHVGNRKLDWSKPNVSSFKNKTFDGYHRAGGQVGTANYWIVIPMVFCENRNLDVLKEALVEQLGYSRNHNYQSQTIRLIDQYKAGKTNAEILATELTLSESADNERLFKNIDGVKFLTHDMGCGGTRQDARTLCGLLAGYITHPNVAGVTVFSLGCQNAEVKTLEEEIKKRSPHFSKPLIVLEQQKIGTEQALLTEAIKQTFVGLIEANKIERQPAPLSKLCIGLECGGSDGFSGISANPALGYLSDMLVAMGGSVILAEFPELCGVEQELSDRCHNETTAKRFNELMTVYSQRATEAGSGFENNPSPGNIKDGLITDAIKSAGAAKKGGTSPIVAVLDYPEKVEIAGLNLLCTPGNDVESTTAEVAAGANVVLFTTGLGTPTGNPIVPVLKVATNTKLFNKMADIMDINSGTIIDGEESIAQNAERMLDLVIEVASGRTKAKAVLLGQEDFIPWKRGVSL